jgi:transcription elongation factor Elf1
MSPTETKPVAKKGFGYLPCPLCGAEATVSVDLDDLDTFRCGECDDTFTAYDLRERMEKWQKVLGWLDSAPTRE